MVEGRSDAAAAAGSATAWSAAGRAPSSARCTASPRAWTTSMSWSPARCRRTRSGRSPRRRNWASRRDRSYGSYEEMAKAEAKRADGIEAVAIVTPNHMHAPVAKAFLKAGIHVICDKPLTTDRRRGQGPRRARQEDRQDLRAHPQLHRLSDDPAGARHGRRRRARRDPRRPGRVRAGLADRAAEKTGQKQAAWRTDPKQSGAGGSHRRHRHPRLQSRLLRHRPDARLAARRPHHASSRAASSTTTTTSCCASRAAPTACSGRARSRPATRTA